MILQALCDYYHRCGDLPAPGLEEREIGFLIVLDKDGKFVRIEDCRKDGKKSARTYLVWEECRPFQQFRGQPPL